MTNEMSTLAPLVLLVLVAACSAKRMNVLMIAVDDLRPQLNCTEVPGTLRPPMHTPHLDKLAAESLVLLSNQVAVATCSPSRTALLTSRHPDTSRVVDLYSYFRTVSTGKVADNQGAAQGGFTTLPQYFKEKGYVTAGAGKIFHPGHASGAGNCTNCRLLPAGSMAGDGQGVNPPAKAHHLGDDGSWSWSEPYFHGSSYIDNPGGKPPEKISWLSVTPAMTALQGTLVDDQTRDHTINTLKNMTKVVAAGKNFFVAIGFHKPHLPFVSPSKFFDLYPMDSIRVPPTTYESGITSSLAPTDMPSYAWQSYGETRGYTDIAKLNASGAPNTTLPDQTTKELRRAYYASVSYTDDNIGRVLAALKENGLEKSTVVMFWGDHGWNLGEHGEWDKHTNFHLSTHAPMMLRIPGVTDQNKPYGIRTLMHTGHIDVYPTLVDVAINEGLLPACKGNSSLVRTCGHGVSLRPLIAAPDKPVKQQSLSQYARGVSQAPDGGSFSSTSHENDQNLLTSKPGGPQPSACLTGYNPEGCTMGYSIFTHVETHVKGAAYRYTEWVQMHAPFRTNWNYVSPQHMWPSVELYNHSTDASENHNIAAQCSADASCKRLTAALSSRLRTLVKSQH